jgi:hypothetical protein
MRTCDGSGAWPTRVAKKGRHLLQQATPRYDKPARQLSEQETAAMSKSNGADVPCPYQPPDGTISRTVVEILRSDEASRRLVQLVALVCSTVLLLGALVMVTMLVRGSDVVAIAHDLITLAAKVLLLRGNLG